MHIYTYSYIHIDILFQSLFPLLLIQDIESSPLCYILAPSCYLFFIVIPPSFLAALCDTWDLSSLIQPVPRAVEAWRPNHWTAREGPVYLSYRW